MALSPSPATPPPADTDMGGPDMAAVPATVPVVTICKTQDGAYVVYKGDEPGEEGEPSGEGVPADGPGQALKVAADVLEADLKKSGQSEADAMRRAFDGNKEAIPPDEGGM